jgi:uncharacterized protein (TIGR02145 family)
MERDSKRDYPVMEGEHHGKHIKNTSMKKIFPIVATMLLLLGGCGEEGSNEDDSNDLPAGTVVCPAGSFTLNGVTWAGSNVADPGVFAAKSTDPGKFYQFDRKTAYSYDSLTGFTTPMWSITSFQVNGLWADANDPCPKGWRIPTYQEQQTLLAAGYILHTHAEGTIYFFGPYADRATLDNPLGCVGFPVFGHLSNMGTYVPDDEDYWNSGYYNNKSFFATGLYLDLQYSRVTTLEQACGYHIRCVLR